MKRFDIPDQVFRDPSIKVYDSFRIFLNGRLHPSAWNSYVAAKTALLVEWRRDKAREEKTNAAVL